MNGLVLVVLAFALSTVANAGEVLRLKSGNVKPAEIERLWDVSVKTDLQRTFVIQFENHVTLEDHKNLTTLGAKILRYIPDDALVVSATARIAKTIEQSSPNVTSVITFDPSWKIAPEIAPASIFSADTTAVLLVRLFPGLSVQGERQVREKIAGLSGIDVVESQERSMVVRAKRSALDSIARVEMVEWI
ncbi:MAG: hypothetical protein V4760_03580, partial [Bdellovibrionota bacterium]